ncbi:MAG: hypothetical protein K6U03_08715, partial [Firmicutes bacterium]|nr:hypothetical protein [Bacillota bacterium]
MQQNINDGAPCCLGSYYFQQYAWHNFYEHPYDPLEVKAWGNPNNPNAGTSWSQWVPIINAAQKAIKWLNAYYAAHKGITLNNHLRELIAQLIHHAAKVIPRSFVLLEAALVILTHIHIR